MKNNLKQMLLGIFLAVVSASSFILADEEDIFGLSGIVLLVVATVIFIKGFLSENNDEKNQEKQNKIGEQ